MADLKISQLTGGGASQAADEYIINRSGSNFKITGANIAAASNAATATKLATARTINGVSFDGSADITISAAADAGTLTGSTLAAGVTASSLTSLGTIAALSINRVTASGQSLTGSQATPLADLAATWNTTGTPTAIKLNITDTASNAASLLMDLQRGATSRLSVDKNGIITITANVGTGFAAMSIGGVSASPPNTALYREGSVGSLVLRAHAQNMLWVYGDGGTRAVAWPDATGLWWTNGSPGSFAATLALWRDADNIFAQRNSTNAQTSRLYRSFTDASNYSRLATGWSSSTALIATEGAGTGSRGNLAFGSAALATSATVGYVMIPSCAGTPTGVPADIPTGQVALHYDSTNDKLYVYSGSWRSTAALT